MTWMYAFDIYFEAAIWVGDRPRRVWRELQQSMYEPPDLNLRTFQILQFKWAVHFCRRFNGFRP